MATDCFVLLAGLILICIQFLHCSVYDLTGINDGYNTEIGNMWLGLAMEAGPLEPDFARLILPVHVISRDF